MDEDEIRVHMPYQVFKNLLASETYTEVIVTNNEKSYYKISLERKTMQLIVEPLNDEEE